MSNGLRITNYTAGKSTVMWNSDGIRLHVDSPKRIDGQLSLTFVSKDKNNPLVKNVRMQSFHIDADSFRKRIPTEEIDTFLKANDLDREKIAIRVRVTGKMAGVLSPFNVSTKISYYDAAKWPLAKPEAYKTPNGKTSCELSHNETRTSVSVVGDGKGGTRSVISSRTVSIEDGHVDFVAVKGRTYAIKSHPSDSDDTLEGTITIDDNDEKVTIDIGNLKSNTQEVLGLLDREPLSLNHIKADLKYRHGSVVDGESSCTVR